VAALAISLNNDELVTVVVDPLDLLDVHISGDRTRTDLASLTVAGGTYPEDRESSYLIARSIRGTALLSELKRMKCFTSSQTIRRPWLSPSRTWALRKK